MIENFNAQVTNMRKALFSLKARIKNSSVKKVLWMKVNYSWKDAFLIISRPLNFNSFILEKLISLFNDDKLDPINPQKFHTQSSLHSWFYLVTKKKRERPIRKS